MNNNTKNYTEQGGDKLVIGGELEIMPGAVVKGLENHVPAPPTPPALPVAAHQPDSTADDMAGIVSDFNALLAKLKAAGLMAAE